ncbi:hypothetical protein ACA910_014615 [Epithemia clementina (nom. ined.)]
MTVPNAKTGGLLEPNLFQGEFWDHLVEAGIKHLLPPNPNADTDDFPGLGPDWMTVDELEALEHQRTVAHLPLIPPLAPVLPLPPEGETQPPDAVVHFAPPNPVVDVVDNDNQPAVVAAPPIVTAEVEPNTQPPQAEVDEIIDLMDDGLFDNI